MESDHRPHPNTYRVPGGKLLAGEYPGSIRDPEAREKVDVFLGAGVRVFIDLTGEGELAAYAHHLAEGPSGARHLRFPVPDMGIPTEARMREILDALDAAEAAGEMAYVHCWGGVGRTGTVVACQLVRRGWSPAAALQEVARLFGTMSGDKVRRHPEGSPQTPAQRAFVERWARVEQNSRTRAATALTERDRVRGALIGLAAGDALGAAAEFQRPGTFAPLEDMVGGGSHGLRAGEWTDDTSMALCLAESLLENAWDPRDQMERYVRWWREGYLSSRGYCFDIGTTTAGALRRFRDGGQPLSGSTHPASAGNGSLMRLCPVPLYFRSDPILAISRAAESSLTTHGARSALDACRYLAALLLGALAGEPREVILRPFYTPVAGLWEDEPLCPEVAAVAAGSFLRREPPEIRGAGYVVQSLEAALWAFARAADFRSGCLAAANLGDDADTTAAVYGQLAGAFFGEPGIPAEWRARLALPQTLDRVAEGLARERT